MFRPASLVHRFCLFALLCLIAFGRGAAQCGAADVVRLGVDRVAITPQITVDKPVWLAGYGWGRQATGIHDPLYATSIVLSHQQTKVALVTIDLIGLQYPTTKAIRDRLLDFSHVVVSSTHNHEGPDTIGLWGATPFRRGVDEVYLQEVIDKVVASVQRASEQQVPVVARFGTARDDALIGDSRLPIVKESTLRVIEFLAATDRNQRVGLLVQWNAHPEALGSENTLVTADFPATTIASLEQRFSCPVAYFSGVVGGLMAPPKEGIQDQAGRTLQEGDFEYAAVYGERVADLVVSAIEAGKPIELTPFRVAVQPVSIPVRNPLYRAARLLGVVTRKPVEWNGDFRETKEDVSTVKDKDGFGLRTEVSTMRFGDLTVIGIPGELYPELVGGRYPEPAESFVDFPDAHPETPLTSLLPDDRWIVLGLANDEIGYIIPKRQWDHQPPFAYDRKRPQYGEVNSCGPDVAPIIMEAVKESLKSLDLPSLSATEE